MKKICLVFVAATLAVGLGATANAQYVWLDKNNVKHYSDKPPPANIPDNRILKTPRSKSSAKNVQESGPGSAKNGNDTTAAGKKQAPMTSSEKNADFNKRRIEQAEKDRKAEEEKKRADAKAQNCERAREYQRTIQSGQRISRTGKGGEREYMGDEERARESEAVNESLKNCN